MAEDNDDVLELDAAAFEARARAIEAAAGKPSVYDVTRTNILSYSQGAYRLVLADLQRVLPADAAGTAAAVCEAAGVADAYAIRRELVNLKKVLLHLFQAGVREDRTLAQLLTFFHCDLLAPTRAASVVLSAEQQRYQDIASIAANFRGAQRAVHDARDHCKAICLMPRHPHSPRPQRLQPGALPGCLSVCAIVERAEELAHRHEEVMAPWARRFARYAELNRGQAWLPEAGAPASSDAAGAALPVGKAGGRGGGGGGAHSEGMAAEDFLEGNGADGFGRRAAAGGLAAVKTKPSRPSVPAPAAAPASAPAVDAPAAAPAAAPAVASAEPVWAGVLGPLPEQLRLAGLPPAAADFVCWVLVARGASKALLMRQAIAEYEGALGGLCARLQDALALLRALRPGGGGGVGTGGARQGSGAACGGGGADSPYAARLQMFVDGMLEGGGSCAAVCADIRAALRRVLAVRAPAQCGSGRGRAREQQTLFVAADRDIAAGGAGAMWYGGAFETPQILFGRTRGAVRGYALAMVQSVREHGWGPKVTPKQTAGLCGEHECAHCGVRLTSLWLRRRVCVRCETAAREQGRCPHCAAGAPPDGAPGAGGGGGGRQCAAAAPAASETAAAAPEDPPIAVRPRRACKARPPQMGGLWCPHERQCFACDPEHSCALCGLVRGDGETVEGLVQQALARHARQKGADGGGHARGLAEDEQAWHAAAMAPAAAQTGGGIGAASECGNAHEKASGATGHGRGGLHALCVDFDKTLASTKSGGSPLAGAHTADAELLSAICTAHDEGVRVAVVTRNAHTEHIGTFLKRYGVPAGVRVLHVARGVRKAAVMREHGLLPPRPVAAHTRAESTREAGADAERADAEELEAVPELLTIFVDDSVAELVGDSELAPGSGVLRVLFTRGPKSAER